MAPLIRNMARRDAQWSKFKSSYMWNDTYHLRRTKFVVYQLATTIVGVAQGLGIASLRQYNNLQHSDIPGFPEAKIDTTDFVCSFAFTIFSGIWLAFLLGAAVFFDLFWPEREEAPCIQWTWKLSAFAASVFQLASCLAITIVVADHGVRIDGLSADQEEFLRRDWRRAPLEYRHDGRSMAAVVTYWVTWLFTFWSTIIMWRAYAHNNKYGPFADHVRKDINSETPLDALPRRK